MPIDTHVRVAAWLHIVMGALAASTLLFIGLAFGAFGAFMVSAANDPQATGVLAWIGGFGATLLIFFIGLAALEIAGAAMLLGGNGGGRVLTIIFSILALANFPIGTAIGVYSLWALLRQVPVAPVVVPVPAPAPSNVANTF
jgi:hypothetical protein